MKTKKYKFTIEEIRKSMSILDLGCCWFDILRPKSKKKMGFDNDPRGNGDGPYLELTCYPYYIKFTSGTHLKKKEKTLIFEYDGYKDVDDFVDDKLADFIRKYFKSIKLTRE